MTLLEPGQFCKPTHADYSKNPLSLTAYASFLTFENTLIIFISIGRIAQAISVYILVMSLRLAVTLLVKVSGLSKN